ncbi:MAG: DUF4124 domain-containing protein [Methyloprofundus sp.]|nr:DUF4124 domain-containing protein [Methyloprofundus sp.]
MTIIPLLLIALSISPAYAKVYKCMLNGQTKYQETPCPDNSNSGSEIDVTPNIVSTKGLRQYIKQDRLPKKLREQKEKDALKARRAWMDREVDLYAKNSEAANRKKALKRKQKK